ncbi:glycoprotein [Emaravirus kiwii]|uniref:Glycoprotein n=1 Tax=Emaravirus kiwii TaxID=2660760 RepID=A0A5Q5AR47_9VIRU|nr:glycoprotein [Emaravirus kiwii]QEE82887.1 glycoprotein [Emaravirus kiwii]
MFSKVSRMSIINSVVAIVIILLVVRSVNNHVYEPSITCECIPSIFKLNKDFIVCFHGCPITPVNSKLYNVTCSYMEDITITLCENSKFVTTKPIIMVHGDYFWTTFLTKTWKLIASMAVWLTMILLKIPSLCIFSLLNKLFNKIMKKTLKKCETCNTTYSLAHLECPTPGFRHRTDYNLLFYVVLIFMVLTTFAKADDNVYNYHKHGSSTEIQVLDKEHYSQDFDVNGYLYTITILNSHLEIQTVNVSEIQTPTSHRLTHQFYSCDGKEACKKQCISETNRIPMYEIRKSHDGMTCFTTSATMCGLCESDMVTLGYKVTTTKVNPYIDVEVKHGNKTELIKIREFSQFIHEPYFVKAIEPVIIESVDQFISGPNVYIGDICNMPSYGCFGPNYIKDGKSYQLVNPKVSDPMSYDREIILDRCIDPGRSDVNSLQKTNSIYMNGTIIKPYEFGLLSIGIPVVGKLVGSFCEKPVVVKDVSVSGCYDCQSGIEVNIKYERPDRCGQVKCLIGKVAYEYFVDLDSDHMVIHSFFDKEDVVVTCNKLTKSMKLDHNKDTSYYKTNSEVHGSAAYDFNLLKHLPNLMLNPKAVIMSVLLGFVTLYMIYALIIQTFKHYKKYSIDRYTRIYKKTDMDSATNEQSIHLTVITGEAQ